MDYLLEERIPAQFYFAGTANSASAGPANSLVSQCTFHLRIKPPLEPTAEPAGEVGTLLLQGAECPHADPNPGWELDPTNQPPRRSFAILTYNLNRSLDEAWEWLFSESAFATIVTRDDLAERRHGKTVNVFFRDGHMERLPVSKVSFPPE
jgi:hypothetical protein